MADDEHDLYKKTEEWIARNPRIYDLFVRFSLEASRSGRRHFGMRAIAERVRWQCAFEYNEEFKINHSYTPYIARRLVDHFPELDGMFEFRRVRYGPDSGNQFDLEAFDEF